MNLALLGQTVRYGFFGMRGFLGAIVGIIVALIVIWAFYAVFNILAAKFGSGEMSWIVQILRIILIAAIAIWFIQLIFNIFPV